MVDPDAPSKDDPTKADWLHWGLYNIPGDLLKYEALDVIEHAASGYSLMDCFAREFNCYFNNNLFFLSIFFNVFFNLKVF